MVILYLNAMDAKGTGIYWIKSNTSSMQGINKLLTSCRTWSKQSIIVEFEGQSYSYGWFGSEIKRILGTKILMDKR